MAACGGNLFEYHCRHSSLRLALHAGAIPVACWAAVGVALTASVEIVAVRTVVVVVAVRTVVVVVAAAGNGASIGEMGTALAARTRSKSLQHLQEQ